MKGKTKAWLIIAILFIVCGILLAGVGVAMGGTLSYSYIFENGKLRIKNGSGDFVSDTVTVSEFKKLNITSGTIDVYINKGDKYSVSYSVPEQFVPKISDGETLNIEISKEQFTVFSFVDMYDENPYITVTVPSSDQKTYDIDASTGDIHIDNVNFRGDIKTSTGDVNVTSANLGNVYIETSTGDLHLTDVVSSEIKTTASTGESHIENCKIDRLTAKTSTGDYNINDSKLDSFKVEGSTSDIKIEGTSVNDVNINVSTGECELELIGKASDYSCRLSSSTGDIKYDGESFEKKYIHDGNGSGSITISTSTGDIKVKFD
ncbi:MAG: DUF4097 domain-containing protein [Lachnospiraceae bacterium]|nr:DUF4097 domain-containing protein [Lachnospiraceae bacterium]